MENLFTLSNLVLFCTIIISFTGATASLKSSVNKAIQRSMESWTAQLKAQQLDVETHKKTLQLLLNSNKALIKFIRQTLDSIRNGYTGMELPFSQLDAIETEIDKFTTEIAMKGKSYI